MLHLHRSERADALVQALAAILAEGPADPFARELVAVPTRGMERWLTQQLSASLGATAGHADGVCAGIDFPFPGRLLADALSRAGGIDPDTDPWTAERMVWPLLEVVERLIDEPWLDPLAMHFRDGRERRFARLRHLAGLYEHYAIRRPELIAGWARGEDGEASGPSRWQAELWRELRQEIGVASSAERLKDACDRLRAEPALADLPAADNDVRPDSPAGQLRRGAARRRRVPRRPPAAAAPLPRPVGRGRPDAARAGRRPSPRHRPPAPATACWPPGAEIRESCSWCSQVLARWPAPPTRSWTTTIR